MHDKIIKIQQELKAPKNQHNSYGGFDYRSCEDILEALKPLLEKEKLLLTINDEIVQIGERYYVKATATLTDGEKEQVSVAYAREEENKKGMDGSQVTGASSSYARKYALNGLFLIDDAKDSDSTSDGTQNVPAKPNKTVKSVNSGLPHTPEQERECPVCGGEMWNNISKKTNPKAPDYRCKDKNCTGVIWPKKDFNPDNLPIKPELSEDDSVEMDEAIDKAMKGEL